MAAVTVALSGTRVNDADSNTNWANLGGGGAGPASEPQLRYQYSGTGSVGAVNKKITSTTARQGVQYDPAAGAVDMTAAANPLAFLKMYVSDFSDVNTTYGCEMRIGSSNADYYDFNVAGSGANRAPYDQGYPAQGGYLIAAINPNISAWREGTTGTPALNAVDYFGFAAQFITGGAKDVNLAADAIDIGRGLLLTRGDGADADAVWQDFVTFDQDTLANRWGVVVSKAGIIYAIGKLIIGESGTATAFTDTGGDVIIFPDGYVGPGDLGVECDIQNASTVIAIADVQLIGRGSSTTSDTRPDFDVIGTSGTLSLDGTQLTNFRQINFTNATTAISVINALLQCELLTQNSSDISDSTIITTSLTSVATLQDPTFGSTTDLHDVAFIQGGAGHAIEIASAGTYNFNGLTFSGYGANGSDAAALDITAASGTVTINVSNGDTPTFKTAGATVVINNNVTVTLTGLQSGSEVRVYDQGTGAEIDGVESSGTSFAFSDQASNVVDIRIFHIQYLPADIESFTIPTVAASVPVQQVFDRNYSNP